MYWISPAIISTVVFVGCLLIKSAPLNAATIFTVLATLRSMSEPLRWIPEALSALIQVKVSLNRLNSFLLDDEISNEESNISSRNLEQSSDRCIEIKGGHFSWEPDSAVPALKDINLEVKTRQKIAVCGSVGAGKSTLLCAILGEVPKISGSVSNKTAHSSKYFMLLFAFFLIISSCFSYIGKCNREHCFCFSNTLDPKWYHSR